MPSILLAVQLVLASVFFVSGLSKVRGRESLAMGIRRYGLLPVWVTRVVAIALPPLEVALAVAYVLEVVLPVTALVTVLLMCGFTFAIAVNLVRGRRFPCNCFGASRAPIGPSLILRNVVLGMLAVLVGIWAGNSGTRVSVLPLVYDYLSRHLSDITAVIGTTCLSLMILFLLTEVDLKNLLRPEHRARTKMEDAAI